MKNIKVIPAILLVTVMILNLNVRTFSEADDGMSGYVEEFKHKTNCSDVSVVIYDSGNASFYGDPEGLYQIGSMTKAFTGLAVQKLIREGKLSEETRVDEIFPGFEALYDSKVQCITVKELLYQTSGYTNSESLYPSAAQGMSLKDWVYDISGRELESAPGMQYSYSNVNFDLLGAIIEEVTDGTYKDYLENEILKPLGLNNTFVGEPQEGSRVIEGSRPGYGRTFGYHVPVIDSRIPAGYFYSNASDMGRWIMIWLGDADIPEEYKEMIADVKTRLTAEGDYYSGWERFPDDVTGHSGGTPNYSSRLVFSEKEDAGVCVLTNLNVAASTDSLCNGLYLAVSKGSRESIKSDVWSVFDRIFTLISIAGLLLIPVCMFIGSLRCLVISDMFIGGVLIALCVILPMIFGAGLWQILSVWAPYSLSGGLFILLVDTVLFGARAVRIKKNAN